MVYSTSVGRVCAQCGWPQTDCRCSKNLNLDPVPSRVVAKLRLEKKGRGGKAVTVIYDLPRNAAFLKELGQDLKRACGTGGTVVDDSIELQGDLRERVREFLVKKNFIVKG